MTAQHNDLTRTRNGKNESAAIWGAAALVVAIVACSFNTSPLVLGASFGAKLMAVLAGTLLGLAGALIGDAIRKFAQPDFVMTTGGAFNLIWIKLFWLAGPQVIGLLLGVFVGAALVLG
jgi:hypothetical protein